MNKKIIALIATGAILATTAAAAGCAAQKNKDPLCDVVAALDSAVETTATSEPVIETDAATETTKAPAETTGITTAPSTETVINEVTSQDEIFVKNAVKNAPKTSSKKQNTKKTAQTGSNKPAKNTGTKTTVKTASETPAEKGKLISEYDKQKYASVVYVGNNANVTIDAANPKRCKVTIRVKSGKSYYEYTMSGKLNRKTGVFNYTNGEKKEFVPNRDKIDFKRQIFTGGQGRITFLTNGLSWMDCNDRINKTFKLSRV